jgi:NAD(P)-dependent dehydrogenase (short-subunit alcohol dehydrogenase family)
MDRLDNKVAIITGSTGGIGQGIAEMFAQESAKVVISGRNSETGEEVARNIRDSGGEAVFIQTDVSKESDCQNLIQKTVELYDKIDVFVNNAGIFPRGNILETSEVLWDRIMAVNLKGAFFCCKHVIPIMQKQKKGSIINIGSSHAWSGFGNIFAYSVSKGGLLTLTKNLARAHGRDSIRVNWITVGWVLTPGEKVMRKLDGQSEDQVEEEGKRMPLGRLQTPEDIAYAAVYLASDESSQVTGAEIPVNGGGVR